MSTINIFRQITVKQIVTENSKEITRQQLNEALLALDQEQLEFEQGKNKTITEFSIKGADLSQINKIRQHFDTEVGKFHVQRDEIRISLDQLHELIVGDEITLGTIEGSYELKLGDKLDSATKAEVVVKDGIVVEIRQ